jgi:sugar phosphate isomerase/epimerase
MDVLKDYIVKIHINDNDARNDLHLPFGEGNVDIQRFYRLLNERRIKAMITLEMTPDKLPATLDYIREYNLTLP